MKVGGLCDLARQCLAHAPRGACNCNIDHFPAIFSGAILPQLYIHLQSGMMGIMLTWEECAALTVLTPEETAAMGARTPAPEFVAFLIDSYLYEEPLKDKPGVKDFIRDDITAAQRRGSFDMSALLKFGLRQRLVAQGYAGEMSEMLVMA